MGLGPVPLARMEKYIEVVEGLLKGKTVEWSEEGGTHKIRFLNPELGLININDPIPTFVSAFGPKARALTAKLGAGWIGAVSYPQREQADIEDMRAAWQRNGRNMADFYAAASTGGCVLDEGEPADSKRCMAQAGPYAAIVFHNLVEVDQFGSIVPLDGPFPFEAELEAYRKVYQKYEPADARYLNNHRGHLMFVRPEEKHLSANVIRGLVVYRNAFRAGRTSAAAWPRSVTSKSLSTSFRAKRTTCCSDWPRSWPRFDPKSLQANSIAHSEGAK